MSNHSGDSDSLFIWSRHFLRLLEPSSSSCVYKSWPMDRTV